MYKYVHNNMDVAMVDFNTILEDCKKRYQGFNKRTKVKRRPQNFEKAILKKYKEGENPIIAEIKPASPEGKIRDILDIKSVARDMVLGGACGISVLTEEKFFNGSLKNLREVSELNIRPVLRKDFIFDLGQIYESYYFGADSLLLIAGLLTTEELKALTKKSRELGMEPLIEIHSFEDISKADAVKARLYVINNRDKDTLKVDLNRSKGLSKSIDGIKIAASGISDTKDLEFVLKYCDAALIGTSIMKSSNIAKKVEEFVKGC